MSLQLNKWKSIVMPTVGFLIVFSIWFVFFISERYSQLLIPSPIHVAETFMALLVDATFMSHVGATFTRILVAFLISAFLGILIGLIVGYYNLIDSMTYTLIDFLRSMPGIVLFPLFILFFGVGDVSRLLVAIFVATPIIIINTKYGVINSNKLRKNMRTLYKLKAITLFYRVIVPEASPYIFTGLRVGISLVIILVIVTEMMLGTSRGLGHLLIHSQHHFDTPLMYAIILMLGCIGFLLNSIFNVIEQKIFHWR